MSSIETQTVNSNPNGQGEKDLFYARGHKGVLVGETKDAVFAMSSGDKPVDEQRVHWPITNRIPEDPRQAFEVSEKRRLATEEEMLGNIALNRPTEQPTRHVIDVE